jgi:hypothetical protein
MADCTVTDYPDISTLTRAEIEYLADRLYGRGVSTITTTSAAEREDLITASRALRRLLSVYERASGRQLACLLINGGC